MLTCWLSARCKLLWWALWGVRGVLQRQQKAAFKVHPPSQPPWVRWQMIMSILHEGQRGSLTCFRSWNQLEADLESTFWFQSDVPSYSVFLNVAFQRALPVSHFLFLFSFLGLSGISGLKGEMVIFHIFLRSHILLQGQEGKRCLPCFLRSARWSGHMHSRTASPRPFPFLQQSPGVGEAVAECGICLT